LAVKEAANREKKNKKNLKKGSLDKNQASNGRMLLGWMDRYSDRLMNY
jgi:hypothetical protein